VGISRSSPRYRSRRSGDEELRERLRQLAAARWRFRYRRLHGLLRREGEVLNHKRVLPAVQGRRAVRAQETTKRVAREVRLPLEVPSAPDQLWSLDFVSDALAWGRKIRLLTVLDAYPRECWAIEVDTSLSGMRVARVLDRLISERGTMPVEIVLDNGSELTSRALDQWAYERGVRLRFIDPRKPVQNAYIESFAWTTIETVPTARCGTSLRRSSARATSSGWSRPDCNYAWYANGGARQSDRPEVTRPGDDEVEHGQQRLRQLVSPGKRPMTRTRRCTSPRERSRMFVERSRRRRCSG
jgi:putative transposase